MSANGDPYEEAKTEIVRFLVETRLPWTRFKQTFDTLQNVVQTAVPLPQSKSLLMLLVRNVHSCFLKTKSTRKGSWERFCAKVMSQVENNLPEGVRWHKTNKTEMVLVKEATPYDILGELLHKTESSKDKTVWECEHGHPLLSKSAPLTVEADKLPKVRQRVTHARVSVATNMTYVVDLVLKVPVRSKDQGMEHITRTYIDSKKAESVVRKLLPKTCSVRVETARTKSICANVLCYEEKLSLILKT
jgi:hypothetical protein